PSGSLSFKCFCWPGVSWFGSSTHQYRMWVSRRIIQVPLCVLSVRFPVFRRHGRLKRVNVLAALAPQRVRRLLEELLVFLCQRRLGHEVRGVARILLGRERLF